MSNVELKPHAYQAIFDAHFGHLDPDEKYLTMKVTQEVFLRHSDAEEPTEVGLFLLKGRLEHLGFIVPTTPNPDNIAVFHSLNTIGFEQTAAAWNAYETNSKTWNHEISKQQ